MSGKKRMDLTRRSRSPAVSEAEMFGDFQEWCLRTYGDSGKTKTVTRRKYTKILQTLLQSEDLEGVYIESNHINAKFKFWVKSKGFQVGNTDGEPSENGAADRPVLYVPIKATVSMGALFPVYAYETRNSARHLPMQILRQTHNGAHVYR